MNCSLGNVIDRFLDIEFNIQIFRIVSHVASIVQRGSQQRIIKVKTRTSSYW